MSVSTWVSVEATTAAAPPPVDAGSCFTPVRGSAIRVTGLGRRGQVPEPVQFAVSKTVASVRINEVTEQASNEMLKNPDDERRLIFTRVSQMIRYVVDIEFLRVDPGVLSLITGVPVALNADGDVVGFDSTTRLAPATFALEVWSKLAGSHCVDGQQMWGYTLFPYLRGGRVSGFQFRNGLVSFNLVGAQTRRSSRWGVGPHDLEGSFERLLNPVSRNTSWRMFISSGAPPVEFCGIQETTDVLDNGTAADPMPPPSTLLLVDSGGAETGPFIIDGGRAS